MFEVKKQKQKPAVVIRAATCEELSNYVNNEKNKLASIEEKAQENKIEAVSLTVNGQKQCISPINKEIDIELGSLALSSRVVPSDISRDEIFIIKCELGDTLVNK